MTEYIVEIIDDDEITIPFPEVVADVVAGEDIPISKIVRSDPTGLIFMADNLTDIGDIIGVTTEGVLASETTRFTAVGRIPVLGSEAGKNYFLGLAGEFTDIPPEDGILKFMGSCYEDGYITLLPGPTIRRRTWP